MGAWGTEIFADDLAADVRDDWLAGIADGVEPATLSTRLIDAHTLLDAGPESSIVFWLALAASQHETGLLQPEVQATALDLIARGGDVSRWADEDADLAAERQVELERLRVELTGPQPAPAPPARRIDHGVRFEVGDAVVLTAPSGARAVAVVVGHGGTADRSPLVEVLLWDDDGTLPSPHLLATAPVLHTDREAITPLDRPPRVRPLLHVMITPTPESAFDPSVGRLLARGIPRPPSADPRDGSLTTGEAVVTHLAWRTLARSIDGDDFAREREITREAVRPRRRLWSRRER
ncbi:hypothetical protein [Frigoribacterium faeni]|uniref:DUF4259 domain-containing protein n=1 Tax=Frigoribacterium faeni TaxID=145483 RepID=A0A7W3JJE7_9MICO|nr:hypothetical protein [Frigoribacterium faeni]MBA8813948.1 hypothetical protein [Frigoribacterium faeni]GEK82077.1 hypothetical protein FFA01_03860 [Frigoribacterium faeni]